MIRITDIQAAMAHLVGWEQDYNPDNAIQEVLTESESGLMYNQASPMITLDNIRAILPDQSHTTFPTWNNSTSYKEGTIVVHNGAKYIATKLSVNHEPNEGDFNDDYNEDFGNGYWRPYDQLSEYLRRSVNSSIAKMVNRFIEVKSLAKTSKSLLEHKTLFDGAGRLSNYIASTGQFVGYAIDSVKGTGVTTQIHRIGLQMAGGMGGITMYLFHSSQSAPIATYNLNVTKSNGYQWFRIPDTFLHYMSSENGAGGTWFVGYFQNDIPDGMYAVNAGINFGKEPCGSCAKVQVDAWRQRMKYTVVSPFRVNVDEMFAENPQLWDLDDIEFTPSTNYGINLELSIGCDLSHFIISQKYMFASVLQKQVAYDLLKTIRWNPNVNVNRNQANVQSQDMTYEMDGSTYTSSRGLRDELERAYKAIELDTDGLDPVCMHCQNRGVTYGVA